MTIRAKLLLLITVLFLTAILNTIFIFRLESSGDDRAAWVAHTNEVLLVSGDLLSNIIDAETGQRGYLLTGSPSYLEPYYSGSSSAAKHLAKLKNLTVDNPGQQELLASIRKNLDMKIAELKETIDLAQSGDRAASLELVQLNKGKQYMDYIREDVYAFMNNERILLEQRKANYVKNRTQISTLVAVEIVFFTGLGLFTLFFLQKNLFTPINLLLASAKKIESGEKLSPSDILTNDEMSHLLTSFYVMSDKVFDREKNLEFKASHDDLTGLKNRSTLFDSISEAIRKTEDSSYKLGVLYLDLNDFKSVNDTLGHDAGDAILKETSRRLKQVVRSSDEVFRIGGDEFLILLRDIEQAKNAENIVQKILTAMQAKISHEGQSLSTSVSIGIAVAPDDTRDPDDIVAYADVAMYTAKRNPDMAFSLFDKAMLKRGSD